MSYKHFIAVLVPLLMVLPGCGKGSTAAPVTQAEAAVDRALNAWVRGESPESLAVGKESIEITDPDWKAGLKLKSFLAVESRPIEGKPNQFRCRVSLSMQDGKKRNQDKEISYNVQLGDKVSISRAVP